MDLTIFDIIRGPWITSKAYALNQQHKQLVLEVHVHANKPRIAEALKKLFNVEVEAIGISVVKGKRRYAGRHVTQSAKRKKAIIMLKEGHSLDLNEWHKKTTNS